ncbi:MAG TPA: Ig-like domain-containing protein [Usitatibacter sp.]
MRGPIIFRLFVACVLLAHGAAHAAASLQPLTTLRNSVAGGASQSFAVRAYDAQGRPSAGETVHFSNDACGFFPNGSFGIDVVTGADGVAETTFTARPQGIYCWIVAQAGARVVFDVLTYLPSNVRFESRMNPPDPKPGQPITLDVSPMVGIYPLYNVDVSATVVAGTTDATVAPSAANTGQDGAVSFGFEPQGQGEFDVVLRSGDATQAVTVQMSATPWQDLWWAGWGENGWGMSVVQHRDILFSVIYAYDDAGKPIWYVMPGGSWNPARTIFSGPLYRPHGAPFAAYDTTRFDVGPPIGQASLDFTDASHVVLSYTIDGVSGRKSISREPFGPVDLSGAIDVGDMWWGGMAQNGWGIAVLQQYRTLFAVWFTYDDEGKPVWYVMPSGYWSDPQTWAGHIYRTTGSPWLARAYDPSLFHTIDVGTFRLRFSGDTGTFDYTVDGRSGSIPIQRQPF